MTAVIGPPDEAFAGVAPERPERAGGSIDEVRLEASLRELLGRRPAVGLAVGVVHGGRLAFFRGHGLADIRLGTPVTEDTVFRIGSVTKLFTAISVMQLWEQGRIDLDAPANRYLRAYRLVPGQPGWRPATVRHLLTHTAGLPEVVRFADLFHPGWGRFWDRPAIGSVRLGDPVPSLAAYYRRGLRLASEPGTALAYSGHGFATLGQIVEDVAGQPFDGYLREHVFDPLGMDDTDVLRSDRIRSRLATGYDLGPHGPHAVTDREWIGPGGGAIYASTRDMARFAGALLGGGGEQRPVLRRATLATMLEPHYQPDPRLPGMGLAFFLGEAGGHRLAQHDGTMPGFHSALLLAPDDDLGIIGFTNGSGGAFAWLSIELGALLREVLGAPADAVRRDIPQHPEIWADLCGRYRLPPRVSDLRGRLAMGLGIEVFVGRGRLMARMLTPIPALYRGFELHPDDAADPYVFRFDLSHLGVPSVRAVFRQEPGLGATAIHTDLQSLSFFRRRTTP